MLVRPRLYWDGPAYPIGDKGSLRSTKRRHQRVSITTPDIIKHPTSVVVIQYPQPELDYISKHSPLYVGRPRSIYYSRHGTQYLTRLLPRPAPQVN